MERLTLCGWAETSIEEIEKIVRIWAERAQCTIEEMIGAIERILSAGGTTDLESMDDLRAEPEEADKEPRARRRKLERGRAQAIEQRYRAEIHRFERERFYRRIFKPP